MTIIISDTNEGPVVNVAAWFGTTVMILGVGTRIWSKYTVLQKWTIDDALIIFTMILGCIMTATISMAVTNGLGEPQSSLSDHQIREFQKYGYATQLLYIPALCLTKITTLVYLRALSPESLFENMNTLLGIFITLWGLGAEFSIAFQCQLPSPWAIISGKCFNTATFWKVSGTIDVVTDIIIVLLPLYLVWSLQMPWKRKSVVTLAFGSRVLVIPFTIWRIYSLSTVHSSDKTLSLYYSYLTTTIQLNFAIFMTCVAFLRPFLENMACGGLTSTIPSMNVTYGKGSKLNSFLSSRSNHKISKVRPSYQMENLSEVRLNDGPDAFGKSESNTIDLSNNTPSIHNDDLQFAPGKTNGREDLGPLRPDKVKCFSRVSNPPLEEIKALPAGNRDMVITRTREWDIQEEYKNINEDDRDCKR